MVWGRITIIGRTELYVCQENVTGLYYRDNVIGPYARSAMIMQSFFKDNTCKSLSCTCCPRSPAISQNHDSPMASEVPRPVSNRIFVRHPLETCPETSSQATGHQRARRCTPGEMAPDPPSNHWAAHQEHEASLSPVPSIAATGGPTRY